MKNFFYLTAICIFSLLLGCQTNHFECPPPQSNGTTEEQSNSKANMLDQGWDGSEQACFYETSQGSQLIPFSWMLALEQPDNSDHFLSDEHVEDLGFLARGFDSSHPKTTQLPVGFVKDQADNEEAWFGFTCAACHTSEIEFNGAKIRVDGAGTLGNMPRLLHELTASIQETVRSPEKQTRFIDRVLGQNTEQKEREKLKEMLGDYLVKRTTYDRRNKSEIEAGNGRLDAFGRIYNRALDLAEPRMDNFNPPDAPVSYPFLWGTHQSDYVQWVGFASNSNIGPLARNAGEVLGVFADASAKIESPHQRGYSSSVRMDALIALEE